jgi:hypothetical protein
VVAAQRWLVRTTAIILLASGCFYVDPINQRPSASIVQDSSGPAMRGMGTVDLHAVLDDPENDPVYVQWRVYSCTDATAPAGCDQVPFTPPPERAIQVPVPSYRADNVTPVQALRVILEATDSHGAVARPNQELVIPVGNAPPTLMVRSSSSYEFALGTPVELDALANDPDDRPELLHVDWQVIPPIGGAAFTFEDFAVMPPDDHHLAASKLLTSTTTGTWNVIVTVTDPLGASAQTMPPLTFDIARDRPPCLQTWAPLTAPSGQTLPLTDPTLFEVLVVDDDLDKYPIVVDAYHGSPTFSWSLLPPGATQRQPLGAIGNSVPLDPASYAPGDVLELRVEIQDRQHIPITCSDNLPTCSVSSDSCIQRLTWRVEVQ